MREFGEVISPDTRTAIVAAAQAFYAAAPQRRTMLAEQFAMDGDLRRVVATEAEVKWPGGRMRVAHSRPEERPPFEWIYEITSDVGEADYFKHYLIREDDIVLAQRKELTPIDQAEAEVILQDLAAAQRALG
ncbi:MAG TPA: hypothetical protein VI322_00940 [Candidatus Saccharimonadia bacterium]